MGRSLEERGCNRILHLFFLATNIQSQTDYLWTWSTQLFTMTGGHWEVYPPCAEEKNNLKTNILLETPPPQQTCPQRLLHSGSCPLKDCPSCDRSHDQCHAQFSNQCVTKHAKHSPWRDGELFAWLSRSSHFFNRILAKRLKTLQSFFSNYNFHHPWPLAMLVGTEGFLIFEVPVNVSHWLILFWLHESIWSIYYSHINKIMKSNVLQ